MLTLTQSSRSFPSVSLASVSGGLPVEVCLIAQLGHGSGDSLIAGVSARQRGHTAFVDALDEPSARLGGLDLARGDATSLYSFVVGEQGHPFHRHAGHRVFTAISGSAGTLLRFSTASDAQIHLDPSAFLRALRHVHIPPDCLFTVRFGGDTWHQFLPLRHGEGHPALFALSCHTDELGGRLSADARQRVLDNSADIPSLTELLPAAVQALIASPNFDTARVPTVALSVDAAAVHWAGRLCSLTRSTLGRVRAAWTRWRGTAGFLSDNGSGRTVEEVAEPPQESLLHQQLPGSDHEDSFQLRVAREELPTRSSRQLLAAVLQGFLDNQPLGVTRLMQLRNVLVKPLGLRTSPLGCPVSSLLAPQSLEWFATRYPVHAQRISAGDDRAEVLLGADDKHLQFRACVTVQILANGAALISLSNRVRTRNLFGRLYLFAINRVHRRYVGPSMLRLAVDHAVQQLQRVPSVPLATPKRLQIAHPLG